LLVVLVLVGLASYGSFPDMGRQLASFPVTHLLAALALAALNYLLRFFRWAYYLRVLHIRVPFGLSVLVFLSGLAMSVTPGKVGELLKSYLLRDRARIPVAASAPVVLMERLTDLVSVVLLGLTGMALLPLPVVSVLVVVLLIGGGGMLVAASRSGDRLFRLPYLRRWDRAIQSSREGLRSLTRPRVVLVAVALGTLAWLSEGVALWVIVQGLDAEVVLSRALPIYAAATLVGAVSALPGGLVGTEGSMVVLLQQAGVTRTAASAGTLLVRLVTLWFAVVIGLAALAWLHRRQRVEDPAFHGSSGIETIGVVAASSPGGEADASVLQSPS
jgi:uncharacterized protein (TIRG00374 family)